MKKQEFRNRNWWQDRSGLTTPFTCNVTRFTVITTNSLVPDASSALVISSEDGTYIRMLDCLSDNFQARDYGIIMLVFPLRASICS